MKMDEIRQLPVDELKIRLEDLYDEHENLQIQHSTHQLDNPMRILHIRKDIARIHTVLREYELGIRK
ncbi:MAG TPA: 50S ribosomal protein L29 [bacterium]|nr:50S ribosomal protein L29 [bacterium]HNT65344.1 50S ribosomal protein L29 [bacterium]HOX86512.1 50S ribosomal protein L29 [bacterium]HPG46538.1 50S ribosomal protein L29 [bacterium]HPM98406.1 50S ribosomal protein L29 [bacterium]